MERRTVEREKEVQPLWSGDDQGWADSTETFGWINLSDRLVNINFSLGLQPPPQPSRRVRARMRASLSRSLQGLWTKMLTALLNPRETCVLIHTRTHIHTRTPIYVFFIKCLEKMKKNCIFPLCRNQWISYKLRHPSSPRPGGSTPCSLTSPLIPLMEWALPPQV